MSTAIQQSRLIPSPYYYDPQEGVYMTVRTSIRFSLLWDNARIVEFQNLGENKGVHETWTVGLDGEP